MSHEASRYTARMKAREFDPLRLDVAALAQAQATITGEWPLNELERLAACAPGELPQTAPQPVTWQVEGELRQKQGGEPEVWLHLQAAAKVPLECQRCLRPVVEEVEVERALRFVASENLAAEQDLESEEDVLALTRSLDLKSLVEDELLLALPIVPRHGVCPQPLQPANAQAEESEANARPNPFAALAVLKRRPDGSH